MKHKYKHISTYLCYLLRHVPEAAKLDMDSHGWVGVAQLIENMNIWWMRKSFQRANGTYSAK